MAEYNITCSRCEAPVTHECRRYPDVNEEGKRVWVDFLSERERDHPNILVDSFIKLLNFTPEYGLPESTFEALRKSTWYDPGDEKAPFFSQAVIYPLLDGKEDARTFFAYLHAVIRAAGFEPHEVKRLAQQARMKKEADSARRRGGLVPSSEMDEVPFIPEPGWAAGLSAEGVGVVASRITDVKENQRPGGKRGPWDVWVRFEGGGSCHFRRLLRVALWVRNGDGEQVWPLAEVGVTDG